MNTTTHILFAEAVFRRKTISHTGWAAAAGAILPDAFIGVFWAASVVRDVPRNKLWDVEYFREPWSTLGAISNSFFLWGVLATAAYAVSQFISSNPVRSRSKLVAVFAASGFSHVLVDFLTHADDAHRHLWPISSWRFESPISYWDPAHNSRWLMPVESVLIFACVFVLWRQTSSKLVQILLALSVLIGVALIIGSLVR